jgi:hypothetical protein
MEYNVVAYIFVLVGTTDTEVNVPVVAYCRKKKYRNLLIFTINSPPVVN